jgi:hypothetical protein
MASASQQQTTWFRSFATKLLCFDGHGVQPILVVDEMKTIDGKDLNRTAYRVQLECGCRRDLVQSEPRPRQKVVDGWVTSVEDVVEVAVGEAA